SPVSDRPSEKAMLTPAPRAVAAPVKNAVSGRWVASATAKMGARVDSDPSIRPLSAGWTRSSRNDRPPADSGAVPARAMALMLGPFEDVAGLSTSIGRRPGAASADLHNLVFQRDYRIIPAIMNGWVLGSPHERRSGIGSVRGTTTAPAPIPGPDQI